MPAAIRLLLTLSACLAFSMNAQAQPSIYGEWVHYMNSGGWASANGECQLRFIEERRYKVMANEERADSPIGIFASMLHGRWIRGRPGSCAHPILGAQDLFGRARTWSIDLSRRGRSDFVVQSKEADCRGDGCNSPDLFKGSFTTTLTLSNGELLDKGDKTLEAGALVFKPLVESQRQSNTIAKEFLERWSGMRTAKNLSDFVKLNTDQRIGMPVEEIARELERYRSTALNEAHSTFEIMEVYLLESAPNVQPREPLLFLQVANRRSDGRRSLETYELLKSNGQWRLGNMKY